VPPHCELESPTGIEYPLRMLDQEGGVKALLQIAGDRFPFDTA